MRRTLWYENSILEWPRVLWSFIPAIGIIVFDWLMHVPWKETLVIIILLGFYIEFDVCTTQIERLMDRIKELEDRMVTLDARTKSHP